MQFFPHKCTKCTKCTNRKVKKSYFYLLFFTALCACHSTSTHQQLERQGEIVRKDITSQEFNHRLYRYANNLLPTPSLHIYLEGDGLPWRTRRLISADPTSQESLMLRAMQLDSDSSVFLGRPCYYQVVDKRCQGVWWTRNRYHPKVVDSLVEIIERLSKDRDQIWLIGHSGGGTLAVLVGRRLSRQVNVVTIAANLDHSVWTDYHGYTPLSGSLNPVSDDRRNPAMKELHFFGNDDKTILPEWFNDYCGSNSAMCITEPNKNHQNGWVENWPLTLEQSRYFFAEK